ncbi:MAG TPA: HAMP domain-containing sensor histidine kinase [Polyangia bacterium]|nr:HAMP domain-containing sensor histidine kinase [Polyangia bacterium]
MIESQGDGDQTTGAIDQALLRLPMIVHELRGPISAIQTAVAVLELRLAACEAAVPQIPGVLAQVRRNVGLLERMAQDLLAVGRSQFGPEQVERQPADLAELVAQTIAGAPWADRVRLTVPPSPVPLACDPDRLGQVVWNLVRNAAEHGRGTAVDVAVSVAPTGCTLVVENDGVLAPVVRAHLFEPFVRGQKTGRGLGLGLYLARRFVEAHGGTVAIDGADDRVRVAVFLPTPPG